MFIKKVIVDWGYAYRRHPYLRILFYDPDGNLFESGNTISSTNTNAKTDNFIVTALNGSYDGSCYPINAVLTTSYKDIGENADYRYFSSAGDITACLQ